jgi:hypothetical protein
MNYDRYPGARQRDIAHICDAYWDEVVCLEGISLAILFFAWIYHHPARDVWK